MLYWSVCGELLLVGLVGLRASVLLAVLLNVGAGLYLLALAHRFEAREAGAPADLQTATAPAASQPASAMQVTALLVFGISGFTALGYEVVSGRG